MNDTVYPKAIDLLMSDKLDYKAIVIELAKSVPNLFVEIVNGMKQAAVVPEIRDILGLILADRKEEAVEAVRNYYRLSLLDAGDICTHIHARAQTPDSYMKYYSDGNRTASILTPASVKIYHEILAQQSCVGL